MATPVQMPKVGISVESCVLTKWHKKTGDKVNKGDLLFTYETDKTTVDEEAVEDGELLAVFFAEGDDVPVMQYVCVIGKKGENIDEFAPKTEAQTESKAAEPVVSEKAVEKKATHEVKETVAMAAASGDGIVKISPRAKAYAQRCGVNPSSAAPTGAEGRIVEKDVIALAACATEAAAGSAKAGMSGSGIGGRVSTFDALKANSEGGYRDEKLTSVRKFIAKAMHESVSSMAQLTHTASFDATDILNFRQYVKKNGEKLGLPNITLNDIVLYAVSRILKRHKSVNAYFLGDTMRYFDGVNLGMAVDTEKGLLVPTIFAADTMTLSEICVAAKDLAKKSQAGTISPDLTKGGTFTVSNLGAFGIESFTPIINPPQVGILGVNTLIDSVKMEDGQIKVYKRMPLSLTYDHRALDGAPASKFLKELCDTLESFTMFLSFENVKR